MDNSTFFDDAKKLLATVKGRRLHQEERVAHAIDLAALLLAESERIATDKEKEDRQLLAAMMKDPKGKVFTAKVADQCFRSSDNGRIADQLNYLIARYGVPSFLPYGKRAALQLFKLFGKTFPRFLVPLFKKVLFDETSHLIIPGEGDAVERHIEKRKSEGMKVNLNHLGEAILGEEEAEKRVALYLEDLANDSVGCISVKVTTISSHINPVAHEKTLALMEERLAILYRAAMKKGKLINLDMEEYRDMALTLDLFYRLMEKNEFITYGGGIALQSYLPDSYGALKEIIAKAKERGGAAVRIRLVKGANMAAEKVDSSLHGWVSPIYSTKAEVDANFIRMLHYALEPDNAAAANIGIASHNLFDIAYGLLLRAENGVEEQVSFEMLEGMAPSMARVVKALAGNMLLYCPTATESEFVNAVAYLTRRLDENSAPENFLHHAFNMNPGDSGWQEQARQFQQSIKDCEEVSKSPRRRQDRIKEPPSSQGNAPFTNEPDTDWALPSNGEWGRRILNEWKEKKHSPIPIVIGGKELFISEEKSSSPSAPQSDLYLYAVGGITEVDAALTAAEEAAKAWSAVDRRERSQILAGAARIFRERRGTLIGAMAADGGKSIFQSDSEVSEAVDFIEYYRRMSEELEMLEDIAWSPKGTVVVATPWNFPCAIPTGGIAAALAAGNAVIFKPARETVLTAWHVALAFWDAGIDRSLLQFLVCDNEPTGSGLIADPRVDSVILTGATETARHFLKLRPGLDLHAETGGKNSIIATALCDRDLAIKDIIASTFGHAGQKCSACSLAILEGEVYDDPHFLAHLRDAAASLPVGNPWDPYSEITPLIKPPEGALLKGLTTLEEGESWLLEARRDTENPNLWSPAIKIGVKRGSFTHQTEFFGPLLAVVRADNLDDAIAIANATPYGLTAGLHSLDRREQERWAKGIVAGNLYINRGITGAIVQRQPFGGMKCSSFGSGKKAGGPNYLTQLMCAEQIALPKLLEPAAPSIISLCQSLKKNGIGKEELEAWNRAICSYAFFYAHYFSKDHDPSKVIGQDNILRYQPRRLLLRCCEGDNPLHLLRIIAAAATCEAPLEVSGTRKSLEPLFAIADIRKLAGITAIEESCDALGNRIAEGGVERIRIVKRPKETLLKALGSVNLQVGTPLDNGRIELLHHLDEVALSINYHRYGNLGLREAEQRNPLSKPDICH